MYIQTALAVIGGVKSVSDMTKGGGDRNGGAGAQSQSRDPWAPAQPYLRQNLQTNALMQKFYQQNPFSDQQKMGFQNQNNLVDQFNGQVAPGLLGMANGMMGQSYSRQRGGAPGSGAGYGGLMQSAGMQQNAPQGLMSGPFSAPTHQAFGKIDFDKMNPFSALNKADPELQAAAPETADNFDEAAYYASNPDILKAGWDRGGWDHFQRYGKGEGRKFTGKGG